MFYFFIFLLIETHEPNFICVSFETLMENNYDYSNIFDDEYFTGSCGDSNLLLQYLVIDISEEENYLIYNCDEDICFFKIKKIPPQKISKIIKVIKKAYNNRQGPIFDNIQANKVQKKEYHEFLNDTNTTKESLEGYLDVYLKVDRQAADFLQFGLPEGVSIKSKKILESVKRIPKPNLKLNLLIKQDGQRSKFDARSFFSRLRIQLDTGSGYEERTQIKISDGQHKNHVIYEYQTPYDALKAIMFYWKNEKPISFVHENNLVRGFNFLMLNPSEHVNVELNVATGMDLKMPSIKRHNLRLNELALDELSYEILQILPSYPNVEYFKNLYLPDNDQKNIDANIFDEIKKLREKLPGRSWRAKKIPVLKAAYSRVQNLNKELYQVYKKARILGDWEYIKDKNPRILIDIFFPIHEDIVADKYITMEKYIHHYLTAMRYHDWRPTLNFYYKRVKNNIEWATFKINNESRELISCRVLDPTSGLETSVLTTILDYNYGDEIP